jgi:hypothetical protein
VDKPLLLIDVDGVISLFGFPPGQTPAGRFEMVDGIAHLLSAAAGEHLRTLSADYELVWCTGWEEKANDYLPRALALPGPLAHLTFDRAVGTSNAHWKLESIDDYAGSWRPLAWIDDAHDDRCHAWAQRRPGPTLLVTTRSELGITAEHVGQLLAWAQNPESDSRIRPAAAS